MSQKFQSVALKMLGLVLLISPILLVLAIEIICIGWRFVFFGIGGLILFMFVIGAGVKLLNLGFRNTGDR